MSVDLFGRGFYNLQDNSSTSELPAVSNLDNGSILKVIDGNWGKASESIELPVVSSSDNGSVLQVVGGTWSKSTSISSNVTQITPNPTMTSDNTTLDGLLYKTSASSVYTVLNAFAWKAFKMHIKLQQMIVGYLMLVELLILGYKCNIQKLLLSMDLI